MRRARARVEASGLDRSDGAGGAAGEIDAVSVGPDELALWGSALAPASNGIWVGAPGIDSATGAAILLSWE